MEQGSNNHIYCIEHKPNRTAVLLGIPMYMYRIKTHRSSYGLNFFQKAVLKFKTKPNIETSTIAACLGLDEKLITTIHNELVLKGLITSEGILTAKGNEIKSDVDGLIIDKKSTQIGYVFQYVDKAEMYPYYVNNISKAVTSINNGVLSIKTGNKGDAGDRKSGV